MTAPPSLTEESIRAHVDSRSFSRGRSYFNSGRITRTRKQGDMLKAHCQGSAPEPYQLDARVSPDGAITANCSCPVGYGGHCKHVVTLLLTWLATPDAFIEVEDLATTLEKKSKEELVELLLTIAETHPSVEILLETSGGGDSGAGSDFYRGQVARILDYDPYGWDHHRGYSHGHRFGHELPAMLDQALALAERGAWRAAMFAYRGILEGLLESDALGHDQDGELISLASYCVHGLGNCLEHVADPTERGEALSAIFDAYSYDIETWGGVGLADGSSEILVEQATSEERAEVIDRVRQAVLSTTDWSHRAFGTLLLELQADTLDDAAFLAECRELGLTNHLVDRLLELNRTGEALELASEAVAQDLSYLLPLFDRHGQADLIEPLLTARLATPEFFGLYRGIEQSFENWLNERYRARGDYCSVLSLTRRRFDEHPTKMLYDELRELASQTGEWESLRPGLLATLSERSPAQMIEVFLEAGKLDDAIEILRQALLPPPRYSYGTDIQLRVAEAAATTRPEVAIEIYAQRADTLIAMRTRDYYRQAAGFLARARDIYDDLGRYEEWEAHITWLRSENSRLWALHDELDRAEL